jgi:hypothetical protein
MRKLAQDWFGDVRRCTFLLLGLAVLKAVVFVGLAGFHVTKPFLGTNSQDLFFPIADRLVNEHRFNGDDSRADSKVAPAYPLLIAALEVAHVPAIPVCLVILQMMADAVTALCLLWLGHLLSRTTVGGIAGFVWSLFPPAVVMSTWITQESAFTTLLVASLVLVVASFLSRKGTLGLSLAAGCLMGLATLMRATPLLIPAALLPAWIWKRKFTDALIFVAAMAAFILPWTIRNSVVLHDRIVVATGTGSVFLLGSDDEQVHTTERKESFFLATIAEGRTVGIYKPYPEYESQIDQWLTRLAIMRYGNRLKSRPLSFVKLFALKFVRLWSATETAELPTELILGFCSVPVVPFGLWQVWQWRKTNRAMFLILGGVLAYFIVMHLVLLSMIRYVIPIYPLLIFASSSWFCDKLLLSVSRGRAKAYADAWETMLLRPLSTFGDGAATM